MTKVAEASAEHDAVGRLARAETTLAVLRRELEHMQRLATLGTLAAGIAHEMNNILTPVLAYAQLAQSNPADSDLRAKALERTIAGVESVSRIADAILGFARNDDQVERAKVKAQIEAALACLGRDPVRDGVNLVVSVSPEAEVRIGPLALQHVLLNLILNALAALDGKGGEVRITAQRKGAKTRITVADTGPGIPKEVAAKLFEPFVTSHARPGNGGAGGSGLGLAVSKRLIESAGGTIEVSSSPGHGATLTVTLPTFEESNDQQKASRS